MINDRVVLCEAGGCGQLLNWLISFIVMIGGDERSEHYEGFVHEVYNVE